MSESYHFYVLEPVGGIRFGTRWAYADQADPVDLGDATLCPVCRKAVRGLHWLPPHHIKLSSAKPEKWGDFLWGAGFDLMVSARFKKIYDLEGLTGIVEWSPPAEVVRVGNHKTGQFPTPPPIYHLVDILWNGANQDDVASGVVVDDPESITCRFDRLDADGQRQRGIVIEEGSWSGADIFIPRGGPPCIMVSERFKDIVDQYRLTNAWLIPSQKLAYDDHLYPEAEVPPRLWRIHD